MTLKLFGGRLKINLFLIPVGILSCYLTGFSAFAAFFLALFFHEISHMLFAAISGVRVLGMEVLPFGCAADLESFSRIGRAKQVVIAVAGSGMNLLLAAGAVVFQKKGLEDSFLNEFLLSNLALACVNMLPILPLDGGRVISVLIGTLMPPLFAAKICAALGIAVSTAMITIAGYLFYSGEGNFSLMVMGVFMLYSSVKMVKNAAFVLLKQQTGKREELLKRRYLDVKLLAAHRKRGIGEVMTELDATKYNIVQVLGDDMRIEKSIDEVTLLKGAIKHGMQEEIGNLP